MSRRYPGIPEPEQTVESIHNTVLELKKLLEIVTQQSGDKLSQAVTFQDLLDRGIITEKHVHTNDNYPANLIAALTTSGDWDPGISINNDNTGITYSAQSGRWARVKDTVTVWFHIELTSRGGLTGAVRVTGLPFDTENVSIPRIGHLIVTGAAAAMADQPWALYSVNASASSRVYIGDPGGTDFVHATDAEITDTTSFYGSLTYQTTDA